MVLEYILKYGNADLRMKNAEGKEVVFHGLAEAVRYGGLAGVGRLRRAARPRPGRGRSAINWSTTACTQVHNNLPTVRTSNWTEREFSQYHSRLKAAVPVHISALLVARDG